jgi:hypothetical protein
MTLPQAAAVLYYRYYALRAAIEKTKRNIYGFQNMASIHSSTARQTGSFSYDKYTHCTLDTIHSFMFFFFCFSPYMLTSFLIVAARGQDTARIGGDSNGIGGGGR